MRDLRHFATSKWPLHPSGMRTLLVCPWSITMNFLFAPAEEGGAAGDTGSAMHRAAAAMHNGKDEAASVEVMRGGLAKYPHADLAEAAGLFCMYAADPRNRSAELVCVEQPIAFQIAPAPEDPTHQPIEVIGTLDQVRRVDGKLRLYDIKTSKKDPSLQLKQATVQVAAYCVGASFLLGENVEPGALILPRLYRQRDVANSPVFWHFPWKLKDVDTILGGVRHVVARIRSGDIWHSPGEYCQWCIGRSPDYCLPSLQETITFARYQDSLRAESP